MPTSMTGYGQAHVAAGGLVADWEIRSVNHRYLDLRFKLPAPLRTLESTWDKVARTKATRGRVDIVLQIGAESADLVMPRFNAPMAKVMLEQVAELAKANGHDFTPDYTRLLGMSALWQDAEREPDPDLADHLTTGLEAALDDWNASRRTEGEAMALDLRGRLATIAGHVDVLRGKAVEIKAARKAALRERVTQAMADTGFAAAEDRVLTEVALLADKLDVSEELTRLAAHLESFGGLLDTGGELGKRLDFLLQETFREITTLSNKSQDASANRLAVECKAELEKCREQVQNLE